MALFGLKPYGCIKEYQFIELHPTEHSMFYLVSDGPILVFIDSSLQMGRYIDLKTKTQITFSISLKPAPKSNRINESDNDLLRECDFLVMNHALNS